MLMKVLDQHGKETLADIHGQTSGYAYGPSFRHRLMRARTIREVTEILGEALRSDASAREKRHLSELAATCINILGAGA